MAVPCGPLGSWLSLIQMTHIDLFVLDVQGAELLVLQTLYWDRLSLGVLIVECKRLGCTDKQDDAVAELLGRKVLTWVGTLRARHDIWDTVWLNETHLKPARLKAHADTYRHRYR